MIDRNKAMIVWNNEFGYRTTATDACGRTINKSNYGEQTTYGWQVDHINPQSNGGSDSLSNLQPLHWKSNECKKDLLGLQRGQCPRSCK